MKSKNLSADNFEKHSNLVSRYLSPRYGQAILVSRNTILIVVNQNMYNITLQAPKLARKQEMKHWYACNADERKVGWSVYGQVIAKFPRMDRCFKLWGFELSP